MHLKMEAAHYNVFYICSWAKEHIIYARHIIIVLHTNSLSLLGIIVCVRDTIIIIVNESGQ